MLKRRNFLAAAGSIVAAGFLPEQSQVVHAAPQAESALGKVKITDVKTAHIMINYPGHIVKITTDSGLYGLGEAYCRSDVPTIIGQIGEIKDLVIGEDPLQVDYLYQKMIDVSRLSDSRTAAISGIETALWDLAGKILNVPVYVLLGGKFREKVLLYHDTGSPNTIEIGPWVEEVHRSLAFGFKAMKFDLNRFHGEQWNRTIPYEDMKIWVTILEAIRHELGPDFPLGVDLHWRYNTSDALRFAQMIEHLNIWYLEDPIPPENADALKSVTSASKVPILSGENLANRPYWRPFIEKQACDMIHPDPQRVGGLLEAKKIADWADLYQMPMFCHNMCTPVGAIASGHACLAIRSFIALESDSVNLPWWQDIVQNDGSIYKDGYLEFSDKPGLGIELNEEVCREHLAGGAPFFD